MARLPPFFALRALEAAARHQSYSRAAAELAVTHGAVSQQIRRLETELGARLFERRGNSMAPTPEAARLAGQVGAAMALLSDAVSEFTGAAERGPLVLSVDPHFGTRWIPARLKRLLAHPAGANLEVHVDEGLADFVTDGVDMGVRYGAGHWPGVQSALLFLDTLFPVCSPAFAREHQIREPRDLLRAPLLRHGHRPWSLWFESLGLEPPQTGHLFEDSAMLLEAAAQGMGVALGRSSLVEQDLQSGKLFRPLEHAVPSDRGFHVVWRADSRKIARIHALRDWLIAEVAGQEAAAA
jgi:LysR family glycine cleavage system transcriptional activator